MKLNSFSPNGHRVFGFAMSCSLANLDFEPIVHTPEPEVEVSDMNKSLFDLIFSVDPRTNLPIGDAAFYLGAETNPDVKRFIELNLHSPVDVKSDTSGDFESLTDDDIIELTRSHNESIESYRSRVFSYIKKDYESRQSTE